jgi:hypothetical protein
MKDAQGRKTEGKYEILEMTKAGTTAKFYTVRANGHTIPGKFNSIATAESAATAHASKSVEQKSRVVKELKF